MGIFLLINLFSRCGTSGCGHHQSTATQCEWTINQQIIDC